VHMKSIQFAFTLVLIFAFSSHGLSQKWVDTLYQIKIDRDLPYGTVTGFSGKTETLFLDVAYPTNDTIPYCGRPLVIVVHGGAWLAGSKDDVQVQNLMQDFAKRGYVSVAINYRLGAFYPSVFRNCNISNLGAEWNCVNLQDTSEWLRAYYRAVQDTKGAMRFMVNRHDRFSINLSNVYLCGFSAGGYTALGAAFLDHESEWHAVADSIAPAVRPASNYDNGCANKYGWNIKAVDMDLSRPSLGSLHGTLHYPADVPFNIRGVGNLYGGMFYNLLDSSSNAFPEPAVYGFHQPNDLIVPYKGGRRVFDGLSSCAYTFCGRGIQNRVVSYSSSSIHQWTYDLKSKGKTGPVMLFDSTKNNVNCAGQIADPSKGGHQLDNYWLRTNRMAAFFAEQYDTNCFQISARPLDRPKTELNLFPNPGQTSLTIVSEKTIQEVVILDMNGKMFQTIKNQNRVMHVNTSNLPVGIYLVKIQTDEGQWVHKKWIKS
jgi:acetyl esterase/lipase